MTVDTFNGEVKWENKWIIIKVKQKKEDIDTEIEFLNTGVNREQVYVDWNTAVESIQAIVNVEPVPNKIGIIPLYKVKKVKV